MLFFGDNFKTDLRVNFVLSQRSPRLYLLKLLHSQCLPTAKLHEVSQTIIVSRLQYTLPVWSKFLSFALINRIRLLLKRLFRFVYSTHSILFYDLIKSCSKYFSICTNQTTAFMNCYLAALNAQRAYVHEDMILYCSVY